MDLANPQQSGLKRASASGRFGRDGSHSTRVIRGSLADPMGFEFGGVATPCSGKFVGRALVAALPDALLADACALAAEAGRRRLGNAATALATLCNRFVGFGVDCSVPEQVAALEALGAIGGPEASRSVSQMIVKGIVQGPNVAAAATAASRLRVVPPSEIEPGEHGGPVSTVLQLQKSRRLVAGGVTMTFDYGLPAELFMPKRRSGGRSRLSFRRFATAADAIRFAVEEFPTQIYESGN